MTHDPRAHQLTLDLGDLPRGTRVPRSRRAERGAQLPRQFALDILPWARFAYADQEVMVAAATRLHPAGSVRARPPAMMTLGRVEYLVREVALGASQHVVWVQMHAVLPVAPDRARYVFGRGAAARGYGDPAPDALYLVDIDDANGMTSAIWHAAQQGFEVYE